MAEVPPAPPLTEADGSPAQRAGDRIREAEGLLVLVDFDGTLAEIQPRPEEAHARPDAREALSALAALPRTRVAVVSGRAVDDVRGRVGLDGIGYAGNHGLEIQTPERQFVHDAAEGAASTVAAVCEDLRDRLADVEGALVEEKDLTATVHYRQVAGDDVDRVERAVREAVAAHALSGGADDDATDEEPAGDTLRVEAGKQIFELKPPVAWDKGRAVEWLRDALVPHGASWHPLYVGDDVTDEDAFRALAGVGTTVRVGPVDESTAADYRVEDPEAVAALLAWIAETRRRTGDDPG